MTDHMYRFRSIHALLDGFNELENQEIYFASPEELNDPLEGYKDIFWDGDNIVWNNLLNHHLFCLLKVYMLWIVGGNSYKLTPDDIPTLGNKSSFPTDKLSKVFDNIYCKLMKREDISEIVKTLSKNSRRIRMNEFHLILGNILHPCLSLITDALIHEGLLNKRTLDLFSDKDPSMINIIDKILNSNEAIDIQRISDVSIARKRLQEQVSLSYMGNSKVGTLQENTDFIFNKFTNYYLENLEQLMFPKWFTACFMSECSNSSVWGHYGENHKGICLIFNTEEKDNRKYLQLRGVNGFNSSSKYTRGQINMRLYAIDYIDGFEEIDFFKSIGNLSTPDLSKFWYSDQDNNVSVCSEDITNNENAWRTRYWDNFIKSVTKKSLDWKYENEYRAILTEGVVDRSPISHRKHTYDFSLLNGIIFGINTEEKDKLKAIEIIKRKCKENQRKGFSFYQAYYCHDTHKIEKYKLNLIESDVSSST